MTTKPKIVRRVAITFVVRSSAAIGNEPAA